MPVMSARSVMGEFYAVGVPTSAKWVGTSTKISAPALPTSTPAARPRLRPLLSPVPPPFWQGMADRTVRHSLPERSGEGADDLEEAGGDVVEGPGGGVGPAGGAERGQAGGVGDEGADE